MTSLLPVLIIAWLGVAYVLFRRLPGATAALVVVIAGQLFLPEIRTEETATGAPAPLPLPLVKFTKANTISYSLLFGSLAVDWRRWLTVPLRWYDLPMVAWCICPLFPPVIHGIGPFAGFYEGGNQLLNQTVAWGVPYWCGRVYLGSREGLLAAAAGVILGGVVYAPFCLLELRLSPQLHRWVYGYHQHDFIQAMREGGFRPMVFMEHGLMVVFWMAIAALVAYWTWRERTFRVFVLHPRVRIGMSWIVLGLTGLVLVSHSLGAVVLGGMGAAALLVSRWWRTALPLLALALLPPVYVTLRYTELWDGQDLVKMTEELRGKERAESLAYRLKNEYKLLDRAKEQPVFGWGDTGQAREVEQSGYEKVVTDSMWIITVGNRGLFGLIAFLLTLLLPVLRMLWHHPPRTWLGPEDAPGAVLTVALNLYLVDHMVNAMVNPVFALLAGGLAGYAACGLATSPKT